MSTSATGMLHNEQGNPWADLTVVVRDVLTPIPRYIGTAKSGPDGRFTVSYPPDDLADNLPGIGARSLEFSVLDRVYRTVKRVSVPDVADPVLDLGVLEISAAVAEGWVVTLGPGQTAPQVRFQNAVKLLVDNAEAWQRLADEFNQAQKSIYLMQLAFDVTEHYEQTPSKEEPEVVLGFDPELSAEQRRKVADAAHPKDARPERLLINAAAKPSNPVDVRILMNRNVSFERHMFAVPGLGVVLAILGLILDVAGFDYGGTYNEVKGYFENDNAFKGKNKVLGAKTSQFARTHAKLAVLDQKIAVGIASPLEQAYYGDPRHLIDDPRHGNNKNGWPIHDVSFALAGPAVADMYEAYRLHWDKEAAAGNKLPAFSPSAPLPDPAKFDGLATVQVVRTLDTGRFDDPEDGEKGILEAYCRAIAQAKSLIYLENQYFTNDAIKDALVAALTDPKRPQLNVIMMLNIDVDLPCYSRWQRYLIDEIRRKLAEAGFSTAQQERFGVFTSWSHETKPGQRPRIAPNYLHSKIGIVDDKWATLGSANLDGCSLDYNQLLNAAHLGEVRNTEVNIVMFNGIMSEADTTPLVDLLRRRLWAEHLGYRLPSEQPDPGHQDISWEKMPASGWAELWYKKAREKVQGLRDDPANSKQIRVLPWPKAEKTLKSPRKHLTQLLHESRPNDPPKDVGMDVVNGTLRYGFTIGDWLDKSLELD